MRLRDVSFRTKLFFLVAMFSVSFISFAVCAFLVRQRVQVGGPIYHEIKSLLDLRAEILPPPQSLLEPALILYLTVHEKSGERRATFRRRFEECRQEFEARRDYWQAGDNLGDELPRRMFDDAVKPAEQFFAHVDRTLMPVMMSDTGTDADLAKLTTVFEAERGALRQLFDANQAAIAKLQEETSRLADDNEKSAASTTRWWMIFMQSLGIVMLLIVIGFSMWIAEGILVPTRMLIGRMREMAEGAGDLTARITVDSRDEIGQLAHWINTVVQRLHDLVAEVKRSSIDLMSTATQIAATAKQQESTMQGFGASSTQIAAAVKEISATSQQLAHTMGEVSQGAAEASRLADSGRAGLSEMESAMHRLADATTSISAKLATIREKADDINMVVTTITKVADQTNLLSINAAIEAEKAGEYGRGFLVVAREIRRLADQTAVATLDIDNIVRHMQSAVSVGVMEMDRFHEEVRGGVSQVGHINGQLGQVIESVCDLRERFEPATEGMRQQSLGAAQINDAMTHLTAGAAQTSASLTEFKQATERLREAVERLRGGVTRFTVAG